MTRTISSLILAATLMTGSLAAQSPTLTESEQLKIQVLNLQYQLKAEQEKSAQLTVVYGQCTVESLKQVKLDQAAADLQNEITKNHEGFVFDIKTGQFEAKLPKPVEKK